MKTIEQAQDRANELYKQLLGFSSQTVAGAARKGFLQCWEEMKANKQTCGFCVEPKEEKYYSDEEIKAMIDRINEQPLQLIGTGRDQLREAAEKVVKYCDEWDETPFRLQNVVEELKEALK